MKTKLIIALFALTALPALSAVAQTSTWIIDPVHSQSNFEVRHLSVSNARGSITNITGTVVWDPRDPSKDSVNAVLDATTINSGSAYRDKDIKSDAFFNTEKFPTLTFHSTSVKRDGKGLKVAGELTLAGVTRPVVLDVDGPATPHKGMQEGLVSGLEATTTIKRTDFNFGSKYPDAVVGEDVKITIDIELEQK